MKKNELFNQILDKIKSGDELNFAAIKDRLYQNNDFSAISRLNINLNVPNAQKRKYLNSIILSKTVLMTEEWFKSKDGREWMKSQNVNWSSEQISLQIFGWKKSYYHKLLRTARLSDETLEAFDQYCENHPKGDSNRTIENLLKFSITKIDYEDNYNTRLVNELKKFKLVIVNQRTKFIHKESIQLSDEIISKINVIISSSKDNNI